MKDNLNTIKDLLVFESEDDFYYLQILQRKKENPEIGSNSRVIKSYYIKSIDYLESRYDEIKKLCQIFNARAMIRLNKRSYKKVAFKTLQNISNTMANDDFSHIAFQYERASGQGHNDKTKKWIIDIDGFITNHEITKMLDIIQNCEPIGDKYITTIPSKNGTHIITKPFDTRCFQLFYNHIDIHKDNPVNLYIP